MEFLFLLLNGAALVLLFIFIKGLIKKHKNKAESKEVRKTVYLTVASLCMLLVGPWAVVNYFIQDPDLSTLEKNINFNIKRQYFLSANQNYFDSLKHSKMNYGLHLKFVNTLQAHIRNKNSRKKFNPDVLENTLVTNRIKNFYKDFTNSGDSIQQDLGYIFLSLYNLIMQENDNVIQLLDSVRNKDNPHYNYILGRYYAKIKKDSVFGQSESLLRRSIKDSIDLKVCYNELARLYYYFGKNTELAELIHNDEGYKYLNSFFKQIVYFRSLEFLNYWKSVIETKIHSANIWGIISAILITLIWILYLRQVDVYEREKWSHTLITLSLSMGTIFLIYPIHTILWDVFYIYPPQNIEYDFIYDVLTIGLIEELVKIIPVLIILRFTKAINEPYDYIFYCSVSALGFALVENVGYIQDSTLHNINARALMASVAHIIFSSTIGYGMMLIEYKKIKNKKIAFFFFLMLAAIMHGFYDFWLIHEWNEGYEWLTLFFFLISVHIWHIYANNTQNISTFYDAKIKIKNDRLRYYLMVSLFGVMMFSYIVNGLDQGQNYANYYLKNAILYYGYFILYLSFSFSRFEIIRGYLEPFRLPFSFLIPKINRISDYSGMPVRIALAKKFRFVEKHEALRMKLPITAILERRIVIDDNLESYVVHLDQNITDVDYVPNKVVIMPKSALKKLNEPGNILIYFLLIPSDDVIEKMFLKFRDFELAGWAVSKKIDESDRIVYD